MTTSSFDWETLAHDWHEPADVPVISVARLRRRVVRDSAFLGLTIAGELFLLLQLIAITRSILAEDRAPFWVAWITINWTLFVAISAFVIRNRRGLCTPADATPDAWLDITRRRADAGMRSARAVRIVTAAQVFVALPILLGIHAIAPDEGMTWSDVLGATSASGAVALLVASGSVWYERRVRRERDTLDRLLEP